jgi:hypothetical protein
MESSKAASAPLNDGKDSTSGTPPIVLHAEWYMQSNAWVASAQATASGTDDQLDGAGARASVTSPGPERGRADTGASCRDANRSAGNPGKPLPLPQILRSKLDADSDRSGASTPDYVRTAAAVADSAALLDAEPAEREIPDDEAGKLGYRRMTATPIREVAQTAAEVADTAEGLDKDDV